jgi:serine protease
MSQLRLGLYGLAILASALTFTAAIGHTQAGPAWQPANITAVNRGMMPVSASSRRAMQARPRGLRTSDRMGRTGAPYAPGRLIVKFRDNVPAQLRQTMIQQVWRQASLGTRPASARFDVVNIDPGDDAEAAAAAFAANRNVEYAQPAYRVYTHAAPTFVPNDPGYTLAPQWNFKLMDMEHAWAIQPGGTASVVVAVVDTGIAFQSGTLLRHAFAFCPDDPRSSTSCPASQVKPSLGDLVLPFARASDLATSSSRFVAPADFIWTTAGQPGTVPLDFDGHGTHVAGTIGELTNNNADMAGIAFNVTLMPVKVIDGTWDQIFHSPGEGDDGTVAAGIMYAADHGAKVINMSIGRTGPANCGTSVQFGCAPVIESAIRYAVGKGCFIAIAGGNEGTLPANEAEVIAEIASRVNGAVSVGAVGPQSNRASYSTPGSYIEIAAPGGDGAASAGFIFQQTYDFTLTDTFDPSVVSTFRAPRFDVLADIGYQGTSMATAHVSGLAALLVAQGITDPAVIEAALEHLATPCDASKDTCSATLAAGRNNSFGFGLINARNTLRGLGVAR